MGEAVDCVGTARVDQRGRPCQLNCRLNVEMMCMRAEGQEQWTSILIWDRTIGRQ
jgi:hypothetical protein